MNICIPELVVWCVNSFSTGDQWEAVAVLPWAEPVGVCEPVIVCVPSDRTETRSVCPWQNPLLHRKTRCSVLWQTRSVQSSTDRERTR